jgi:hypothetical protein
MFGVSFHAVTKGIVAQLKTSGLGKEQGVIMAHTNHRGYEQSVEIVILKCETT